MIHNPLLERDDRIVGDPDALGAYGGAALGDVAVADALRGAQLVPPVERVERMHLQRRRVHQVAGPDELLVQVVVPEDMADVLAEEALDALPELLHPVHVLLLHPPGAVGGVGRARRELPDPLLHPEVPAHVGDQVLVVGGGGPWLRRGPARAGGGGAGGPSCPSPPRGVSSPRGGRVLGGGGGRARAGGCRAGWGGGGPDARL